MYRVGIGQDSHRFLPEASTKPCIIGGVIFDDVPGFMANSDGDVVFHALCNAITSLTGEVILGNVADDLLKKAGITDSRVYLEKALKTLGNQKILHIAFTLEGKRPKFLPYLEEIRTSVAKACGIKMSQVGLTATTGEGLTDFGCGDGVQCFCIVTVYSEGSL
ncbi:MAG: 2-C-methyl-D-erythritol 2,4-cyclodiphosphate synthase [Chlamydiia bacterium]|nr:2-C-methyl-D-erythritol 2,4-cyclodiphosphate synthase [Chlamydiia bacterium]